jgi:hypothetical protein
MGTYGLKEAYANYWSAKSRREDQAAYNEIKLFGGKDGFACDGHRFAYWLIRTLRRIAYRIELYIER